MKTIKDSSLNVRLSRNLKTRIIQSTDQAGISAGTVVRLALLAYLPAFEQGRFQLPNQRKES